VGGVEKPGVITFRNLTRAEIPKIWTIDRSEIIENIYVLENGSLVLKPDYFDARGWPPGEADKYTPILLDCFDRGGWFYGAFDGESLVGVAILESKFIGKEKDQLQLKFLNVSHAYRKTGLGSRLFELARSIARERGAKKMYISATPSENAISFYLRRGCAVTPHPDRVLLELEPEDIHLVCEA
jgi:predicted N-acetyltransferase YhbS